MVVLETRVARACAVERHVPNHNTSQRI